MARDRRLSPPEQVYFVPRNEDFVRARLVRAGVAMLVVFFVGIAGYRIIGGGAWTIGDCAYMVLITITSVGYAEVLPVSQDEIARFFTMIVLVVGMGVSFYFLSALTAFIIEGDLHAALWRRRMSKRMAGFHRHVIVCGAGETGLAVTSELLAAKRQVVVVERSPEQLERLQRAAGDDFVGIIGDATEDATLREAGVDRAFGVVATLQNDQDNLFVAVTARQLNPSVRIVSRGINPRTEDKLRRAGANAVVSPNRIGGQRMARELLHPNVMGFFDLVAGQTSRKLSIGEVAVPAESALAGEPLSRSGIRDVGNALVLAITDPARGESTYNPPPDFVLRPGMRLIVMVESDSLGRVEEHLAGR